MEERIRFERELALLGATGAAREQEGSADQQARCRQKWEATHDALPAPVRDALEKGQYPLAVGLAIHAGIRDENLLTNMVFLSWYGPERGYCPLAKKEDTYIYIWKDIRKTMVRPRLAAPSPPVPQAGGIVCIDRKGRRLAEPAPDSSGADTTGRYEYHSPNIAPQFTFRINQAGKHVEAVLTTVILPGGKVNRRDVYRFHGDLQQDGSFLMFSRTQPDQRASLRRDPATGALALDTSALPGGKIDRLDLVAPAPTLMENAVSYLPAAVSIIRHHEWFPLTRIQVRNLVDGLAPGKLDPLLKQYFDAPSGDRVADRIERRKSARPLDNYLFKLFSDKQVGIHYLDVPLARLYARTILSESRWKRNLTRSHLDWIQIMLGMVARGSDKGELSSIQHYLGLRPNDATASPDAPQHTYKATLKVTGAGFFVHGYSGTITIEKTNPPLWQQGKVTYGIWFGGLSVSPDISIGDETVGYASTASAWQPPDIPGTVSMAKGGISVGKIASAGGGFLHIYGSEIYPPMQVIFGGAGLGDPLSGPPPRSKKDLIPSVDLSGSWGKIQSKSFPDIDYSTIKVKTDHAIDSRLTQDVHFCLDSALLTEDARQALRIMCANELPSLMSPTSRLVVIGHTDRSDTAERNLTLSAMRAENTWQAIEDIMGKKLAIRRGPKDAVGKGENEAIAGGRPDKERNPKYRRVDVILDGRLVLTLRAE